MQRPRLLALLCLALSCGACQRAPAPTAPEPAQRVDVAAALRVVDWPLPATGGGTAPDLVLAPDGRLLLSWIGTQPGRRDAVQFAAYDASGHWQSAAKTVAVGTALLTDGANSPHILATADGALWMHWLQKGAAGGYAADIWLTRSPNDGMNWAPPVRAHDDATATEHGFAALWPASPDSLGMAWLDGRNTAPPAGAEPAHAGQHDGAMTLRAATFDPRLRRGNEAELDAMTCDCCQTDVAITARGPLLVYRGRDRAEIRDILATRFDGKGWSAAHKVHDDQWKMTACPVNGPAVAAREATVIVAWYTEAGARPALNLARSTDAGDRFAAPVELDHGATLLGRADVAFDGQQVVAVWLREEANGQSLQLARYSPDLSKPLQRIEVANLQGRGRGTGFPKVALRAGVAHVAWTDVVDGHPQLRGAMLR